MNKITAEHIVSTDNIPINRKRSDEIVRHAQEDFCAHELLMANHIPEVNKELFRMEDGHYHAHLKEPLEVFFTLDTPDWQGNTSFSFKVHDIELWKIRTGKACSHYRVSGDTVMYYGEQKNIQKADEMLLACYPSLADLLSAGVKGTVKRSFRRWREYSELPFAGDGRCITKSLKQTVVPDEYENVLKVPEKTEALAVQKTLESIVKGDTRLVLSARQCKKYDGYLRMVYPYRNKYGEVEMFECVLFDLVHGVCMHVPVTLYRKTGTSDLYAFAVPHPKKQIVYHRDLIENAEDLKIVVICDSVEIAEANQENAPEGVVFISWICDEGHLEEVDLSPLLKAKEIAFLIVNHSKRRLEEAYVTAEKLVAELRNVKGFAEKTLSFYQAEYEYQDYRMPYELEQFVDTYQQSLGTLIEGSELEMTEEQFHSMVKKAKESLLEPRRHFWDTAVHEKNTCVPESPRKDSVPQFIIHPWVFRGEITGIYAKKNHGKSPLVYTLAIAATCYKEKGNVDLFPERMIVAVPELTYRSHKVLFLDFELGQREIDKKLESIGGVYWPDPKKQKAAYDRSKGNLIVVNMQDEEYREYYGKDLSSPEYQQFLFDRIEAAKDEGIKGQPVDMVVIDTYNKFVGTESIKTNMNFTRLTRRLREMGIAVVLTGQLNANDNPRGFQQKMDDEYATIVISREDDMHAHSLEDTPHTISLRNYRGGLKDSLLAEFSFKYPMNGKLMFLPENGDGKGLADECLREYVKGYVKGGYSYPEIASMLGMKEKTLYDLVPRSSLKE